MKPWVLPIAAGSAGVALGVLLGWLVFDVGPPSGRPGTPGMSKARESAAAFRERRPSRFRRRHDSAGVRRTTMQSGRPRRSSARDVSVLVPRSLLESLIALGGAKPPDDELFPEGDRLIGLLGITSGEQCRLNEIWRRACAQAREREAESLHVSQDARGVVTMVVPGVPYDAVTPGTRLEEETKDVLGEDRGEIFLAAKQLRRKFAPHTGATRYTITTEFVGDGRSRFHIVMEGGFGRKVWVGDSIPPEMAHLAKAAGIPVDFAQATEEEP